MKCSKCGAECKNGEKFCMNCGREIVVASEDNVKEKKVSSKINFDDTLNACFKYIIKVLMKPIDALKEYKDNMSNPIFALTLSVAVSLVMVIANMISSIFSVIRVQKYTFGKGYETLWQFSNIKDLNFLELIFKNFFIYALIILVIAGVFYLSSLVIKKEINFFKSLTITASSMIPFVLCSFILVPILTLAWSHFIVISLISIVYSVSLLISMYNEELALKGNTKVYYYSVNVSILVLICYVVIMSFFKSALLGL